MADTSNDLHTMLDALAFAARAHRDQRRKDDIASPYINHPIEVCRLLATVGSVTDRDVLVAALLHDTVEDTPTGIGELRERFGPRVATLVEEVTDDKSLDFEVRKELQVEGTQHLSAGAKAIRIADKISNVSDIGHSPPSGWSRSRRRAYLDWTERVVAGCRGVNAALEHRYDRVLHEASESLGLE